MIRVAILGAGGRMGRMNTAAFRVAPDMKIVARIETNAPESIKSLDESPVFTSLADAPEFDVLVDFSLPAASMAAADQIAKRKCAWLLATTGFSTEQRDEIHKKCRDCAIFESSNMSFGVALMHRLCAIAAKALSDWDCEIIETHHRMKLDAPSGTANALAKTIAQARKNESTFAYDRHERRMVRPDGEIGISSLRGGTVAGEHQAIWFGDQERLEIHHSAESRAVFAHGALRVTRWLYGRPAGVYSMDDFVGDVL